MRAQNLKIEQQRGAAQAMASKETEEKNCNATMAGCGLDEPPFNGGFFSGVQGVRRSHLRVCATDEQAKSHLPLRHLPPDSRSHQAGCADHRHQWTERLNMFPDRLASSAPDGAAEALCEHNLTRRTLLAAGAVAGHVSRLKGSSESVASCEHRAGLSGSNSPIHRLFSPRSEVRRSPLRVSVR